MQFKILFISSVFGLFASEKCPALIDNCGDISSSSKPAFNMDATFYSEPDFKGDSKTVTVNGAYGCSNDIPEYMIKSFLSTASTQVTLHYGKDCVGHVISQMQGGTSSLDSSLGCPGSIFIKFNRYGSC